jgi:hypothetical protein
MKYFKNALLAATLAVASLGLTSFSANAILITQDILVTDQFVSTDEFLFGTVTINVDDALLGNGIISVFDFVSLTLLFGDPSGAVFDFEAQVDSDNIFAGIEALFFDTDDTFLPAWAYSVAIETFSAPADNSADVFDTSLTFPDNIVISAETARLGQATFVPEPSTVALFGLVLVAMGLRRRVR